MARSHAFVRWPAGFWWVAALAGLGGAGSAASNPAALITAARIEHHVRVLASDAFQGRAPASPGEDSTLAYLERAFAAARLEPAVDGSYRQSVPLVSRRVRRLRAGVEKRSRPVADLELGRDVVTYFRTSDRRFTLPCSEMVFAGHGIHAPEYEWDDYADLDVRGKVVLVLAGEPALAGADSMRFRGRALTFYGTTAGKSEEAARRGAVAIVSVHDPAASGYPWDALGTAAHRAAMGAAPSAQSTPVPGLGATLRNEKAAEILAAAGHELADLARRARTPGFHGFPLGLTLEVEADLDVETLRSHNVIGRIRGSERPHECVVYTAHWDHVGIGTPVNGDSIYNGAVDNATGTAALIEIAAAFAAQPTPPRRSVLFVATTAEEQGLLGSKHYADHPLVPLEDTVAALNLDALFPFGAFAAMTVVGLGSSDVEDVLARAAAAEGRLLQPDPNPELGAFFRSDHYPFAKKGVPALFAVGGPNDAAPDSTVLQQFEEYVEKHYHRPSDEWNAGWDLAGVVQDARIYYHVGRLLANDERIPNWRWDHEFRTLRDRSREARR